MMNKKQKIVLWLAVLAVFFCVVLFLWAYFFISEKGGDVIFMDGYDTNSGAGWVAYGSYLRLWAGVLSLTALTFLAASGLLVYVLRDKKKTNERSK